MIVCDNPEAISIGGDSIIYSKKYVIVRIIDNNFLSINFNVNTIESKYLINPLLKYFNSCKQSKHNGWQKSFLQEAEFYIADYIENNGYLLVNCG